MKLDQHCIQIQSTKRIQIKGIVAQLKEVNMELINKLNFLLQNLIFLSL